MRNLVITPLPSTQYYIEGLEALVNRREDAIRIAAALAAAYPEEFTITPPAESPAAESPYYVCASKFDANSPWEFSIGFYDRDEWKAEIEEMKYDQSLSGQKNAKLRNADQATINAWIKGLNA